MSSKDVLRRGAFLLMLLVGCGPQMRQPGHAMPPKAAPDFTAASLEGATVELSSLRGKVVILHIWAAWNCADELPGLDGLAARLPASELAVVAVSIDRDRRDLETIVDSRAEWTLDFLHDPTTRVARLYDPSKFPAAYVIDRAGMIRHEFPGVRAADLRQIEARAKEVIAEAPVAR